MNNWRYFNKKSTHFLDLAKIGRVKFTTIITKNATHDEEDFCNFEAKKLVYFVTSVIFNEFYIKNHDFRHPT